MSKKSKKLLIISPNFFPLAGIGAQRVNGITKELARLGYKIDVFTVDLSDYRNIGAGIVKNHDEIYSKLGIQIHRISAKTELTQIERIFKWLKIFRLLWFFNFAAYWDRYAKWPNELTSNSEFINIIEKADAIISFVGPYSGILTAYKLKKLFPNIKWIVDARDPLSEHFGWLWPSKIHWWIIRILEKKYLKNADLLVVVTEEMKQLYIKRNILPSNKVEVITNGF